MTLQEFAEQFSTYIRHNGDSPKDWYVGITSNPEGRLFEDHMVEKHSGVYIYDNAGSEENARNIKKYLIESLGTKGEIGSGVSAAVWVYTYKISETTLQ